MTGPDELVDPDALSAYLEDRLGPVETFAVDRHMAGHSNETLFVTWGEREFVLRRPPPGETAESAHDVLREYRVMDALQGTDVPVPPTVLACADETVIGCEFFLTERLDGDVIRLEEPERFASPEHRERIGQELVDVLAAIHAVEYERVGLGEFGRPAGYLDRQVSLWREQFEEWLLPKTSEDREVAGVAAVGEWLEANVPDESDHTLVHGDYKLDNTMFGPAGREASRNERAGSEAVNPPRTGRQSRPPAREHEAPPELVGVFDWEMSTLGDPLADLGWLLLFWRQAKDEDMGVPEELAPEVMTREGYPTRRELVARYERTTGREYEHDRFYRGLAAYKIAAACEAMYLRHITGAADDPMYPKLESGVPAMVERARRIVADEEPL